MSALSSGTCENCWTDPTNVVLIQQNQTNAWWCQVCVMNYLSQASDVAIVFVPEDEYVPAECDNCGNAEVIHQKLCESCTRECVNCGSEHHGDLYCLNCAPAKCANCGTDSLSWCDECQPDNLHDYCHDDCHYSGDCGDSGYCCSYCGEDDGDVLCTRCRENRQREEDKKKTNTSITQTGTIEYDDGMVIQLITGGLAMLTPIQAKLLAAKGYTFGGVVKLRDGEFVAEATKDFYIAAHNGESPRVAAKNLIKMLVRR